DRWHCGSDCLAHSAGLRAWPALAFLAFAAARQLPSGWASLLVACHSTMARNPEVASLVHAFVFVFRDAAMRRALRLFGVLRSRHLFVPRCRSSCFLCRAPYGPGACRRLDVGLGNVCLCNSSGRYHHPAPLLRSPVGRSSRACRAGAMLKSRAGDGMSGFGPMEQVDLEYARSPDGTLRVALGGDWKLAHGIPAPKGVIEEIEKSPPPRRVIFETGV